MSSEMQNIAVIVGAGKGKRMESKDKAFLLINKKPVLAYTITPFEKSDLIDYILLVVQKNKINSAKKIVREYEFKKIRNIVAGGRERQDSVYNALEKIIRGKGNCVLIHDTARPLVNKQLIKKVIAGVRDFAAVIPAVPLEDTIKTGDGFVRETLERDKLWSVQTPQAFNYDILKRAHKISRKNKTYATDDASLIESIGYKVKIVSGYFENIKITRPSDLVIAEALLKGK